MKIYSQSTASIGETQGTTDGRVSVINMAPNQNIQLIQQRAKPQTGYGARIKLHNGNLISQDERSPSKGANLLITNSPPNNGPLTKKADAEGDEDDELLSSIHSVVPLTAPQDKQRIQ
jgi:hypothetical protein